MKVTGTAAARYHPDRRAVILFLNEEDNLLAEKLFVHKQRKDEKEGGDSYITYELEVAARERTYKQINTVWALITIIFISMNGRKPHKDEAYELYLDVLALYANKVPNRFTGELRPVHLSESDIEDAASLISHCMNVIVEYCDLALDLQADVRKLFNTWQGWRGEMAVDPLDYDADGNPLPYQEWRKNHLVSDASGAGGYLERSHIVSGGADKADYEEPWNWLMLTALEHRDWHNIGWQAWSDKYPHLKSRILRARQLAGA